jgi:hypothetical protein
MKITHTQFDFLPSQLYCKDDWEEGETYQCEKKEGCFKEGEHNFNSVIFQSFL